MKGGHWEKRARTRGGKIHGHNVDLRLCSNARVYMYVCVRAICSVCLSRACGRKREKAYLCVHDCQLKKYVCVYEVRENAKCVLEWEKQY